MGLFSGIVEGIRGVFDNIVDTSFNIAGKLLDFGGGGEKPSYTGGGGGEQYTHYDYIDGEIIDEWVDWIFETDS